MGRFASRIGVTNLALVAHGLGMRRFSFGILVCYCFLVWFLVFVSQDPEVIATSSSPDTGQRIVEREHDEQLDAPSTTQEDLEELPAVSERSNVSQERVVASPSTSSSHIGSTTEATASIKSSTATEEDTSIASVPSSPISGVSTTNQNSSLESIDGRWLVPVTADVSSGFDLSNGEYGSGNRGIEYDTAVGETVSAVDDGVVVFKGSVAGTRYVTIEHADGLRSTYGRMEQLDVLKGDEVEQSQAIGTANLNFILTARDQSDTYLDPQLLIQNLRGSDHSASNNGSPQ